LRVSRSTIRLKSTNRIGTETDIDDVPSRGTKRSLLVLDHSLILNGSCNELKSMNKRRDEDREEVRTFRKEYGECEERKRYDMRLLAQQVTKLERDLRDAQKDAKTIGHDSYKLSLKSINATRLFSGKE